MQLAFLMPTEAERATIAVYSEELAQLRVDQYARFTHLCLSWGLNRARLDLAGIGRAIRNVQRNCP